MNKTKKSVLKLSSLFKPKKPTFTPKQLLTLGLIIVTSAFITYLLVRQVYLWRLRVQLTAKAPMLAVYDPVRLKNEVKTQSNRALLIDLRNSKEFTKGHIKASVSLPWTGDLNTWLREFRKLNSKNKAIVIYEHSQVSVAPQELALYLRKTGLSAYYLAIGYNEWRHFHTFWLPESEWGDWQVEQYVDLKED